MMDLPEAKVVCKINANLALLNRVREKFPISYYCCDWIVLDIFGNILGVYGDYRPAKKVADGWNYKHFSKPFDGKGDSDE